MVSSGRKAGQGGGRKRNANESKSLFSLDPFSIVHTLDIYCRGIKDKRVENGKHLEIRNSSIETKERGGRERAGRMKGEKRKIGKRATPVEF